jgi:CheY-like chemotaxis protein
MDGSQLARRLREDGYADLFMVALSGFGKEGRNALREFDDHLLKPASVESIVRLLNSLGEIDTA